MYFLGKRNRTKEIELMELGLTCSKFLKRSCEIELISYILKQELELICYVKLELKTGIRTNLLRELELKKVGIGPKMRSETKGRTE